MVVHLIIYLFPNYVDYALLFINMISDIHEYNYQ